MGKKSKWALIAVAAAFALALSACGGQAAESSGSAGSSDAQAGSVKAMHTDEAWATIEAEPTKKTCFGCHDREALVKATENYAGVEGLNPHASHTESYDCTKCHSLTGTNVLVCNTACHGGWHGDGNGWPLPDGWQNPTEELPAADGVEIPHNAR